jgi:hypothetical protein
MEVEKLWIKIASCGINCNSGSEAKMFNAVHT